MVLAINDAAFRSRGVTRAGQRPKEPATETELEPANALGRGEARTYTHGYPSVKEPADRVAYASSGGYPQDEPNETNKRTGET